MHDEHGRWLPDLSIRGFEVFNSYARYLMVDGPRKAGKSLAIAHRVARHLFENNGAVVGIITKTLKNGKVGVWSDLTNTILPQWIDAKIGMSWVKPPTMDVATKMSYARVRNAFGGYSEVQLHSLENVWEVEAKFKGTRFSLIWLSEADQFEDRIVFDALTDQLRVVGIPYENHTIIADLNPPEEGLKHWLADIWINRPASNDDEFENQFQRIQFSLDDNTFLDPREKSDLINKYAYDKQLHARYVLGEWVEDVGAGHFADVFVPSTHIIGECTSPNQDECSAIVPGRTCFELFTGWDLGDVNHGCSFAAKREDGDGNQIFDLIDEVLVINRRISIADFTEAVMEKIDWWEQFMFSEYGIQNIKWRHWSDNSAWRYRSASDVMDELVVRQASQGKVILHAVTKGSGSVGQRIKLTKKLLFERRLFVSAQLHGTIKMLRELRKGPAKSELIRREDKNKHIFDAITYMLMSETPMDIERRAVTVSKKPSVVFTPL
jgi:PBSX family phage terminase large subunit